MIWIRMAEKYEWIDEDNEEYRSVWIDTKKELLYAEYGNW